jgi:hypothetical protein
VQCPDLFVYSQGYSDWFFCEVKGPRDKISETQKKFYEALEKLAERPINIIRFRQSSLT